VAAAADAYATRGRRLYERVDALVSPSAFLRDRLVDGGLPAGRLHVLPNPVVAAAAPRPLPPGPPRVLYASRLVAEKGVGVLLDAAARLPAGVRVRIAGSGRVERAVRDRVAGGRLPVDLLGPLPPGEVAAELRAATAAVLPALWWENCPMAVLEAAAQGVPVVASAVGGVPELVDDGGTGLLVPPGDPVALAAALTRLVRDPAAAAGMGSAAWARVRERHDPGAHVAALLALYGAVRNGGVRDGGVRNPCRVPGGPRS
jgi:glycosyltransferase involved in cell wall biosynthesis